MSAAKLRVKVLSRVGEQEWLRYFPGPEPVWGGCRFLFSPEARSYDWLVVYNDLPPRAGERFSRSEEILACPRDNSLLVTHEPASVKIYGTAFTRQFGHVLTSQTEQELPHPHRIYSQPALRWYYGTGGDRLRSWREMRAGAPVKSRLIATVSAAKQHQTRVHERRVQFIRALKNALPELDIYGRGVRPMADKAEAIDAYHYHLAIENHFAPHHWTEKLADSFLGLALPFYAGCPNAAQYFPEDSFVPVDIYREEDALLAIKKMLRDNEYARRLPALREARRRVLEEYNFFAVISAIIAERHQPGDPVHAIVRSRRAVLARSPSAALRHLAAKLRIRTRDWFGD
jgi:hypothetical protein